MKQAANIDQNLSQKESEILDYVNQNYLNQNQAVTDTSQNP